MRGTIGIVGLGIMGGAFAQNLVAGGWKVVGCDIDQGRCAEARSGGVEIAQSADAVADSCHDIITSLPTAKAVLDTARIVARAKTPRRTVIETSTLALDDKLEFQGILAEAGHTALDCPMSGTGAQAKTKDLVVYASGDAAEIERLEPVLLGFARKVWNLGAYGNGSKMKFVANHLVAVHNIASAEAMVLGMKAGFEPRQIIEVIGSGAGTSRVFELRAPMMAANRYLPATMRSSTWAKDLDVIGRFAAAMQCPTPLFNLSATLHAAVLATGHGAEDTAAICAVLEKMAGIEREPRG